MTLNLRSWLSITVLTLALAACASDITDLSSTTDVRLVNAVYNLNTTTAPGSAIDLLIDSSATTPGAAGLAMNTARDYAEIPTGVHSFVARVTGANSPDETLFTTSGGKAYLPKQALTAVEKYTVLAIGVNPSTPPAYDTVEPLVVTDDPFAPPQVNGVYQTRFKFINAAPYASGPDGTGAFVQLYVTPGTTPVTSLPATGTGLPVGYRGVSSYVNLDAGDYVLTFAKGTVILASVPVTMAAGEVHTYVLLNTGPVTDPAFVPGPANHTVLALTDAKF